MRGMLLKFYAVSLVNHFRHRRFKLKTQEKERWDYRPVLLGLGRSLKLG